MYQENSNNTANSYTNEITFNLYTFDLWNIKVNIIIGERSKDGIVDKRLLKSWKKFFTSLNEGKDFQETLEDFVVEYFEYEDMPFKGREKILEVYNRSPKYFLCNGDLEKIRLLYRAALRDKNIDSILEE
jgi:hypothetical protein